MTETIWDGFTFREVDAQQAARLVDANKAQIVNPSISCYDLKAADEFQPAEKKPIPPKNEQSYLTRELKAHTKVPGRSRGRPKKVLA